MARYVKQGSTRTDILEQMFKEIHNHEDAKYHSVGNKDLNEYTQFSEISPTDYEELIEAYIDIRVAYDGTAPANKDVHKINFDFENYGETDGFYDEAIANHRQLKDGTALIWCYGGGDWEMPVQFVLYIDPKNKVRAYVPSDGNVYCHKCKCAIGSCECDDDDTEEQEEYDDDWYQNHLNFEQMYQDVCNRIETK